MKCIFPLPFKQKSCKIIKIPSNKEGRSCLREDSCLVDSKSRWLCSLSSYRRGLWSVRRICDLLFSLLALFISQQFFFQTSFLGGGACVELCCCWKAVTSGISGGCGSLQKWVGCIFCRKRGADVLSRSQKKRHVVVIWWVDAAQPSHPFFPFHSTLWLWSAPVKWRWLFWSVNFN